MIRFDPTESRPVPAWYALVLVRLMVGGVFLSEGIQKFLFPAVLGPGRFSRIGFAFPELIGYGVGAIELLAGALLLLGLFVRFAALPLIAIMLTALVTTKLPILLGHDLGPFHVRALSTYGFWAMAHETRTDWAMLLGSVVLLIGGSGPLALDRVLRRRRPAPSPTQEGSRP